MTPHDIYRILTSANLTVASAAGGSASTAAFTSQTHFVRLVSTGITTSTSGVRYAIGETTVTANGSSALLPLNWVEIVKVSPGQTLAALGNDSVAPTGGLNIVQLTD